MYIKDNIVAIATAFGFAGIGIIRISGNNLVDLIARLTQIPKEKITPRYAIYANFFNQETDNNHIIIDSGILLYFPAPYSFTGEDVAELQVHGSPIGLNLLLKQLLSMGCRMANNGEFTKRAYLNNKLDLCQAESIISLIHAENEIAFLGNLQSVKGKFSQCLKSFREQINHLRSLIEANLDFSDEYDIQYQNINQQIIIQHLSAIKSQVNNIAKRANIGNISNNGIKVVIIGQANVGKSTIFNQLICDEIAIVTNIPGTTRDVLRHRVNFQGIPFVILDTAGFRETENEVEKIGINLAKEHIYNADICLFIVDATIGISKHDQQIIQTSIKDFNKLLLVYNKIDMIDVMSHSKIERIDNRSQQNISKDEDKIKHQLLTKANGCFTHDSIGMILSNAHNNAIYITAREHNSIDILRNKLVEFAYTKLQTANPLSDGYFINQRQLASINCANKILDKIVYDNINQLEIIAEELRRCSHILAELIGEVKNDDILDIVFKEFCIGK